MISGILFLISVVFVLRAAVVTKLGQKKSLVFGNQPNENCFSTHPPA